MRILKSDTKPDITETTTYKNAVGRINHAILSRQDDVVRVWTGVGNSDSVANQVREALVRAIEEAGWEILDNEYFRMEYTCLFRFRAKTNESCEDIIDIE